MYPDFIKCSNNIEASKVFTAYDLSNDLLNERQGVAISFRNSIEFSIIHTET